MKLGVRYAVKTAGLPGQGYEYGPFLTVEKALQYCRRPDHQIYELTGGEDRLLPLTWRNGQVQLDESKTQSGENKMKVEEFKSLVKTEKLSDILKPILDQAKELDIEVDSEAVTALRTQVQKLIAQKATLQKKLVAKDEQLGNLESQLADYADLQSDLTRERDEAREHAATAEETIKQLQIANLDLQEELSAFGVTDDRSKEEVAALIVAAENDWCELKNEVDLWVCRDGQSMHPDHKEAILNAAMHLAGMFQAVRQSCLFMSKEEVTLAKAKVDEADQWGAVIRALLGGLRVAKGYRLALEKLVSDVEEQHAALVPNLPNWEKAVKLLKTVDPEVEEFLHAEEQELGDEAE